MGNMVGQLAVDRFQYRRLTRGGGGGAIRMAVCRSSRTPRARGPRPPSWPSPRPPLPSLKSMGVYDILGTFLGLFGEPYVRKLPYEVLRGPPGKLLKMRPGRTPCRRRCQGPGSTEPGEHATRQQTVYGMVVLGFLGCSLRAFTRVFEAVGRLQFFCFSQGFEGALAFRLLGS